MKILYLTKYSRNAGSSRLRSYQYFPYLEKEGFEVEVSPLFNESYLQKLYMGKSTKKEALQGYLKRFLKLFAVGKYDKIVIEKELFPYLPAFAERLFSIFRIPYCVDYDDAVFHNYDLSSNKIIQKFLSNKIDRVMKYSACVVAGNSYLADRARKAGAKRIEIIPTVIDLERYREKNNQENSSGKFVVGWIGTKTTFEKHLLPCRNWIKEIQQEDPDVHFHIVGITEDKDLGPIVKYIPWTEETETNEIQKMDVGIMPLEDSPWEKGKCAYKLIQYAACGIPGIASDVGMNKEVTIDGQTGYLAESEKEWKRRILELKNNPELRRELGRNARKLVEEKYCIQVTARKWIELLKEIDGR